MGLYDCDKMTAEPKVTRFPILLMWWEFSTKWDTKLNIAIAGWSSSLRYLVIHEFMFVQKHTYVPSSACTPIHLPTEGFLDARLWHLSTKSQGYCTYSFWHYPRNARYKILGRCSKFVFNRPGGSECLFTDCVPAVCRYLNVQVLVPCCANRQPPTHFVYQE